MVPRSQSVETSMGPSVRWGDTEGAEVGRPPPCHPSESWDPSILPRRQLLDASMGPSERWGDTG